MSTVPIYNAYSGELYNLLEEELKTIIEGEIPLTRKPNSSCKLCFGRGSVGYDSLKKLYHTCPKCVYKNIHPNYTNSINFNYINITNPSKISNK
jgi:hypothetical protein